MFKFRGFRASFDFITGKQHGLDYAVSPVSVNGAYRRNTGDFNDGVLTHNPPKKLLPSMVQLPTSQATTIKTSKSTGDLTKETTPPTQNITRSSDNLSMNANRVSKRQLKEQKKIEKQQRLEQKKQEKIAFQARQRQEKLAAEERKKEEKLAIQERQKREKLTEQERQKQELLAAQEAKRQANLTKKQEKPVAGNKLRSKKKTAPIPPQPIEQQIPNQTHSQVPQNPDTSSKSGITEPKQRKPAQNNSRNIQDNYSTNTLESSISRSSGPPPYGEFPEIITDEPNGNITFGKPVADSSWDLISQHRVQMSKNTTAPLVPKRKKDLQYNVGNLRLGENSDA